MKSVYFVFVIPSLSKDKKIQPLLFIIAAQPVIPKAIGIIKIAFNVSYHTAGNGFQLAGCSIRLLHLFWMLPEPLLDHKLLYDPGITLS